ncbi:ADP-ribosylglycohydrolase family protein [Streptomyces sp. NPDC002143]
MDAIEGTPDAVRIPHAFLDFGAAPSGENRPQECFSALFMLKRQLERYGIRTPGFDFAAIAYLHKSGADVRSLIEDVFPRSELAFAAVVADALLQVPAFQIGTALVESVRGRLSGLLEQRRIRRHVPRELIAEVMALPPDPDLADQLPRFFAQDLRAALASRRGPRRIALLFDTYESFAGEVAQAGHPLLVDTAGPRWIRTLLGNLPLGDGVLVVMAGRTPPRWHEALLDPIPEEYVELVPLGPLHAGFAHRYLAESGVDDPELRAALVAYASVEPDQVHPLVLALCADVALAAAAEGSPLRAAELAGTRELLAKERELAARLLSRVGPDVVEAVLAVAAARSFDREVFDHLGARLDFPTSTAIFRRITGFSFVTPYREEGAAGRFAVHALLRRALSRMDPGASSQAHAALAAYYDAMPADDFTARLERVYHRGRLDAAGGMGEWRTEMERALATSRFDRCRALIVLHGSMEPAPEPLARACSYLVAKGEIALGHWEQAEQVLAGLPQDSAHALLLRADLAFVRGDFDQAMECSTEALTRAGTGAARLPVLYRAGELRLFLGRFDEGRALTEEGLALLGADGDANQLCRWHVLLAELEFFSGGMERAKEQLRLARQQLAALPEAEWDPVSHANLRVDEAVVAEADDRPLDARAGQGDALRIRRAIADARGAAHATNGLGLAALQLADPAEAERCFTAAAVAARDLGEELLLAKTARGRAEAAVLDGRLADADRLADQALSEFHRLGVPYDVVHGRITKSRVQRALGDDAGWLGTVEEVRSVIEHDSFHSLYLRCPEVRPADARRIAGALRAFAAGDALGVPWEGKHPSLIERDRVAQLPAAQWEGDWPRGCTSDDTEQTLLVAGYLADEGGRGTVSAEGFLALLAERAAAGMRGIGPTTTAALDHFRATGRPPDSAPSGRRGTNGAAMRVLPVGWAVPVSRPDLRRRHAESLARATHADEESIASACVMAALAAWSVESVSLDTVLDAGREEAEWALRHFTGAGGLREFLDALDGRWRPPAEGIGLAAGETAAAVAYVLTGGEGPAGGEGLAEAMLRAVLLGGDTDTVAALAGGVLGGRDPDGATGLPWWPTVRFEEQEQAETQAGRLAEMRCGRYRPGTS